MKIALLWSCKVGLLKSSHAKKQNVMNLYLTRMQKATSKHTVE